MNKNILIMMRALSNPNLYTRRERAFNAKEISDVYLKKRYKNNDWGDIEDLCQHEDVEELDLIYRDRDDFIKSVENEVAHMEAEINNRPQQWLIKYFNRSNEDRQSYVKEVERLNGIC
jgi:hypothetical protein